MSTFLLFLYALISMANCIDVGVLSIKRLYAKPPLEWFTFMNGSTITITLIGPSDRWFAIGIGNDVMDTTHAFVVYDDGTLTERELGPHNPGDLLPTEETDLEYIETALNGVRTVVITRSREGSSDLFYTFPSGRLYDVGIIAAWSREPGLSFFDGHGTANRLNSSTDFLLTNETTPDPTAAPTIAPTSAPTLAPTTAPTLAPTTSPSLAPTAAPTQAFENRYDLWGITTLGGHQIDNINLVIGIEYDTDTVFINITGPTAQWFAIGFGSGSQMRNKYAIIVDWTPETTTDTNHVSIINDDDIYEYFLGHHVVDIDNDELYKFVEVKVQFETEQWRRNVLLQRATFHDDDDEARYFNFSKCNKRYSLIWARGEHNSFEAKSFRSGTAHNSIDRGTGSIWIEGDGFSNCNEVKSMFDNINCNMFCVYILFYLYCVIL